jgi:putative spermidine/putrescine transport system permease protein
MMGLRRLFLGAIAVFLLAPLIMLLGVSLNEKKRLLFPPQGFSGRWYIELCVDPGWSAAILNSLLIAATAALLAVSIAAPLAYALWRSGARWLRVFYGLGVAPFVLPPVITALGLLSFWIAVGAYGAYVTVIISHGVFLVTLPLVTIGIGLAGLDREDLEAAATLGADERTRLRSVVIPQVLPYALSGGAFAFVLSLNEYIISYMVAGFTMETLPIKIFNSLRYGYTPAMTAVAVLFAVLTAAVFGLIGVFGDLPRLLGAWRRGQD